MTKEMEEFIEKHGGYWDGQDPEYTYSDWKWAVTNEDTRLGYWEWAYKLRTED